MPGVRPDTCTGGLGHLSGGEGVCVCVCVCYRLYGLEIKGKEIDSHREIYSIFCEKPIREKNLKKK